MAYQQWRAPVSSFVPTAGFLTVTDTKYGVWVRADRDSFACQVFRRWQQEHSESNGTIEPVFAFILDHLDAIQSFKDNMFRHRRQLNTPPRTFSLKRSGAAEALNNSSMERIRTHRPDHH